MKRPNKDDYRFLKKHQIIVYYSLAYVYDLENYCDELEKQIEDLRGDSLVCKLSKLEEKEKAKKPITHTSEGMYAVPKCPTCGGFIPNGDNYCRYCGQRLDWSEDEQISESTE